MTETARLVGGPAHGREYAVADGEHTLVCDEADQDITTFLTEWDPLEALYDPLYGLAPVSFSQHLYTKRHWIQGTPHPCVRDLALVRHRYPWLHQGLDPDDPLVISWVLAEPVDRTEWLVWEFGGWMATRHSTRPGVGRWLAWASPERPWSIILSPTRPAGRNPPVLSPAHPPDLIMISRTTAARTAAVRARLLYPGPVGEMLARELDCWAEFGYRFTEGCLIDRLTDFLLDPTRPVDRRGCDTPDGTPNP